MALVAPVVPAGVDSAEAVPLCSRNVIPPFRDHRLHVLRDFGVESYYLLCARVDKAECLGMESLAGAQLKAVLDELAVLGIDGTFAYIRASISGVIE